MIVDGRIEILSLTLLFVYDNRSFQQGKWFYNLTGILDNCGYLSVCNIFFIKLNYLQNPFAFIENALLRFYKH